MLTSGAGLLQSQQPGLYAQLLVEPGAGDPWDEIIKNDLNRTYPDNIHFAQSRDGHLGALYNVLRASARHNAAIGYCQVRSPWLRSSQVSTGLDRSGQVCCFWSEQVRLGQVRCGQVWAGLGRSGQV